MGIAALTIVCARELLRYGVKTNAIAPGARTQMTLATPGFDEVLKAPDDKAVFDKWHPGNTSPIALYLATDECRFNGQVFETLGGRVGLYQGWTITESATADHTWTIAELEDVTKNWPVGPPEMPQAGTFAT